MRGNFMCRVCAAIRHPDVLGNVEPRLSRRLRRPLISSTRCYSTWRDKGLAPCTLPRRLAVGRPRDMILPIRTQRSLQYRRLLGARLLSLLRYRSNAKTGLAMWVTSDGQAVSDITRIMDLSGPSMPKWTSTRSPNLAKLPPMRDFPLEMTQTKAHHGLVLNRRS